MRFRIHSQQNTNDLARSAFRHGGEGFHDAIEHKFARVLVGQNSDKLTWRVLMKKEIAREVTGLQNL